MRTEALEWNVGDGASIPVATVPFPHYHHFIYVPIFPSLHSCSHSPISSLPSLHDVAILTSSSHPHARNPTLLSPHSRPHICCHLHAPIPTLPSQHHKFDVTISELILLHIKFLAQKYLANLLLFKLAEKRKTETVRKKNKNFT